MILYSQIFRTVWYFSNIGISYASNKQIINDLEKRRTKHIFACEIITLFHIKCVLGSYLHFMLLAPQTLLFAYKLSS